MFNDLSETHSERLPPTPAAPTPTMLNPDLFYDALTEEMKIHLMRLVEYSTVDWDILLNGDSVEYDMFGQLLYHLNYYGIRIDLGLFLAHKVLSFIPEPTINNMLLGLSSNPACLVPHASVFLLCTLG